MEKKADDGLVALIKMCVRTGDFEGRCSGISYCKLMTYIMYHDPLVCVHQAIPPIFAPDVSGKQGYRYICKRSGE